MTAAGFWSTHGVHTATIAGPMVLMALIGLAADIRAFVRRHCVPGACYAAAALSLVAAATHLVVCPEHFSEATLYGVFFAACAVAQAAWSFLVVVRLRPWLVELAVLGNLAVVTLWAVTRTAGIPLGPERGEVESIGLLDVIATASEVGVVVACFVVLHRLHNARAARPLPI